jgi:hypothetical protein
MACFSSAICSTLLSTNAPPAPISQTAGMPVTVAAPAPKRHLTRRLFFQTTPQLSASLTARIDCNPRLRLHQVASCSCYVRRRHFAPSNQNSTASPPDCRCLIKAAPVSETNIPQPSDFVDYPRLRQLVCMCTRSSSIPLTVVDVLLRKPAVVERGTTKHSSHCLNGHHGQELFKCWWGLGP